MFVLNEDEYREFKRYKSNLASPVADTPVADTPEGVKCPICGREYPNENILAHHLK